MKSKFCVSARTRAIVPAVVFLCFSSGAFAQSWLPTAGGDYNTGTNWTGGNAPNLIGATATINTNISATAAITFTGGNRTVGILEIGDTNNSNGFTFGTTAGSTLILDNGALVAEVRAVSGSAGQTIAAPLRLDSASTKISNLAATVSGSTRTLTLSGAMSGGNAGAKALEFHTNIVSSVINMSGAISDGAGTVSITKTGNGILTLAGNNSGMTGGVTLSAGTININHASALGTGTFNLNGGSIGNTSGTASLTIGNTISWGGDFTHTGNQTLVLSSAMNMTADRTIGLAGPGTTAVGTLTLNGNLDDGAGTFNLTTTGNAGIGSILRLAGTNTYGGTTTINGGLVRFINAASLPSNGDNSVVIGANGAVSVAGALGTTLAGALADTRLSGTSTGALALQGNSSDDFDASAKFQTLSIGADVGSSPVTYSGTITAGSSGYFIGGGGGSITFGNVNAFTGGSDVTAGNGGGGTVILTSANDYTGTTTVKAGTTLVVQNSGALGATSSGTTVNAGGGVDLRGGVVVNGESLTFSGTNSTATVSNVTAGLSSTSGNNEWNGNLSVATGSDNARISVSSGAGLKVGGNIAMTGTNAVVLTGAGTGEVSGNITGTAGIIQNGGSTWTLSGTGNTYTGTTRIDNGTVSVSSIAQQLGNSTSQISLGETTGTGRLRYTGSGETTTRGIVLRSDSTGGGVIEQAGTGALVISGNVTSNTTTGSNNKTLSLQGSTSGTGELSGTIADTGGTNVLNLSKSGTGTWTISGAAKAYEGTTTVTGGILNVTTTLTNSSAVSVTNGTFVIGANNVIRDASGVTLGAGGVLQAAGFTDIMGALTVTGNSMLDLIGNNTLTFSGATITSGGVSITGWSGASEGNGAEKLFFTSAGTFTSGQLAAFTFLNPEGFAAGTYSAKFIGTELVPDALIPEPSTIAILMMGGAGLMIRRRRR